MMNSNGTKSRISKVTVILQCSSIRTDYRRNNSETTLGPSFVPNSYFVESSRGAQFRLAMRIQFVSNTEKRIDCDDLGTQQHQQQHDIKQIDFKNKFQEYKNFRDLMLSTTQSQLHTLAIYLIWLINRKANKLNSFIRSIVLGMELELLLRFRLHYV